MEILKTIVTILCTGGVFAFLEFLIRRRDEKKGAMSKVIERLDGIEARQDTSEQDDCRLQLLVLLNHYPTDTSEIMKVAERYFKPKSAGGLGGDWYATSIFNKWLVDKGIGKPEWFNSED